MGKKKTIDRQASLVAAKKKLGQANEVLEEDYRRRLREIAQEIHDEFKGEKPEREELAPKISELLEQKDLLGGFRDAQVERILFASSEALERAEAHGNETLEGLADSCAAEEVFEILDRELGLKVC